MTVLTIAVVWLLSLALYVVLQARRPRWEYPSPPERTAPQSEWSDAA